MYGNFPKATDRKIYRPLLPENHGYRISLLFADQKIQAKLNNFTSFGFSLNVPREYDELCFPGQITILSFSPSVSQNYSIKAQIVEMDREEEALRLSVRVISDGFVQEPVYEAIQLSENHLLSGLITHPFFYKTSSFFEVREISREKLVVEGIQPDFTLFEDMEISFTLGMFQPSRPIKGLVSQVTLQPNGKVQCAIKLTKNLPKVLIDQLNKFLMQYTSASPEQIRKAGFKVLTVKEFIHYRFAETQADYEAVLRTRRFAYSGVQKVDSEADLERVSYFFDDYSHILMVMHNEEIIGSATMIVGDGDKAPFEIQTFFDEDNPVELPPADKTIEVAALCLHPEYRDTDILHGIFEQIYMLTMMLNKDYIIASSDKFLIKLYKSIGFKLTPFSFVQPKYNNLHMSVLVINRKAAQSAIGVKKLIWWPLWGVINKYLRERRIIKFNGYLKLKSAILRLGFKTLYFLKYRRRWND
ncbi:GNAT family N-acyltransferase [Litoribrevibacter euphylliae]|uniref:GNAT family N-acyltransferase n=1 Tax=Litoribrevibacter euphylliae TaxID=1834034 RepID=A0ABV7HGJ8_9GAMM